jgi:hypothetical protein
MTAYAIIRERIESRPRSTERLRAVAGPAVPRARLARIILSYDLRLNTFRYYYIAEQIKFSDS